jgi:hypothetical protein
MPSRPGWSAAFEEAEADPDVGLDPADEEEDALAPAPAAPACELGVTISLLKSKMSLTCSTAEVALLMVTSKIWPALVATYIRDGHPANLIELTASIPIRSGSKLTSTIDSTVALGQVNWKFSSP